MKYDNLWLIEFLSNGLQFNKVFIAHVSGNIFYHLQPIVRSEQWRLVSFLILTGLIRSRGGTDGYMAV